MKEALRLLLKTTGPKELARAREFFSAQVAAADMPETTSLWTTVNRWWPPD